MRALVECKKSNTAYLMQYCTSAQNIIEDYWIVIIDKQLLRSIKGLVDHIEEEFNLYLRDVKSIYNAEYFRTRDILLVYIGNKQPEEKVDIFYDMHTHKEDIIKHERKKNFLYQYMNGYIYSGVLSSIDYLLGIQYAVNKAKELNKSLAIYTDLKIDTPVYKKSLLKEITRALLSENKREASCTDILLARQNEPLYRDVFYELIPEDEEIYVIPNINYSRSKQYYEQLGITYNTIFRDYGILQAQRKVFDAHAQAIRSQVEVNYLNQILTPAVPLVTQQEDSFNYSLSREELRYKGRGTYIGIVSTSGIDYTHPAFLTEDGRTRIGYIWEQQRGNEGTSYYEEDINRALASENPYEIVPIRDETGISTIALGVAGGYAINERQTYKALATECQFLVAKVNKVSDTLQRIYGGVPYEDATLFEDFFIGLTNLINIAEDNNRPITLITPYGTNIDSHRGDLFLTQLTSLLARSIGSNIIAASGEEANKNHHQRIEFRNQIQEVIEIVVRENRQNIVGTIWKTIPGKISMMLYPPNEQQAISLDVPGIVKTESTTVYLKGNSVSFDNGSENVMFRIENPRIGNWKIVINNPDRVQDVLDIWISQYSLNKGTVLFPSSAFISVYPLGCTAEIMCVGAYNEDTLTATDSSGRGFAADGTVSPTLVTDAVNIIAPNINGTWSRASGTLVASGIMAGVSSILFSKFVSENAFPFPNSLVMQNIMLRRIERLPTVNYPNPTYGFGVFNLDHFNDVLFEEIIRKVML